MRHQLSDLAIHSGSTIQVAKKGTTAISYTDEKSLYRKIYEGYNTFLMANFRRDDVYAKAFEKFIKPLKLAPSRWMDLRRTAEKEKLSPIGPGGIVIPSKSQIGRLAVVATYVDDTILTIEPSE